MKRKMFSSALCIVLSFLMIVYAVPSSAVAYAIEELTELLQTEETPAEELPEQSEDKELDALFELEEMRTADTKYVRMSDGTYKALVYSGAVHELDENGKYVEIDNSLSATLSDYESGNARVKFAKKVTGNERIFKLKKDSYQIAVALEYAEKGTNISVLNDGKEEIKAATKLEEISTLSKITSSVSYKDILEGVDLEYVLAGENLKENIIVKEAAESYVYTFALSLNGLAARLTDEGAVLLENEDGEVVYTMPAPFMTDANGVYSEDVSYALEAANGNGKYTLTVTASSAWMNAEERAFPVTIDPTLDSDASTVKDISVASDGNIFTYYNNCGDVVGSSSTVSYRTYIQFGLPNLPVGSVVSGAYLYLNQYSYTPASATTDTIIVAKRVLNGWTNDTSMSWSSKPAHDSAIIDYAEILSENTGYAIPFDLTALVKEWYAGTHPNYGVSLSGHSTETAGLVKFKSMSFPSGNPFAEVTFINSIGTEEYFSYSTQSAGAAGNVALNDYSGQITASFTDAVSDNSALSVSVGHVYNSILASKNYDADGSTLFSNMKTGLGFMLTTQQTLQIKTVGATSYAVYTDSDGTIHYFQAYNYIPSASGEGTTEYADTDGLGLTAVDPNSATFAADYAFFKDMGFSYGSSIILMDRAGNQLLFYCGIPAVYKDKNQNLTKYLYDTTSSSGTTWFPESTGSQLRAVVQNNARANGSYTTDITVATLSYDSDGYLSSIASPGRTVLYAYESYGAGKILTAIAVSEYLNSSTSYTTYTLAEYGYTNGILTSLRDTERQYGLHYTYDTDKQKYVGYYEFAGTIASHTVGGAYEITYEPGQTTHKYLGADQTSSGTHDDIYTVKVFDYYGRTICSYTKDHLGRVYGATSGSYTEANDQSKNKLATTSTVGMMATNLILNPSFNAQTNTFCFNWEPEEYQTVSKSVSDARTGMYALSLAPVSDDVDEAAGVSQSFIPPSSESYCFSVYVNMKNATDVSETGGIWLEVMQGNNAVAKSTVYSGNLENDSWKRIYVSFSGVSGQSYTLKILGSGITGAVLVDDAQLEKSSVPSEYNLLSGQTATNLRAGWIVGDNASAYSETATPPAKDAFTVADQMSWDLGPQLVQTVSVNASGKCFTLSGWAKANAVASGEYRNFALVAEIKYAGNLGSEELYVPFNPSNTAWQYAGGTVIPSYAYKVESITVRFAYDGNPNTAHVAGISLVESDAVGYTYDHNGNVTATTKAGLETSTYTYSGTKLTATENGSIDANITYDNPLNDRLPTTVTTSGITTEYTYDTAGNVIGTVMRPEGSTNTTLKISASSAFSSNLTKLTSTTDERGNVTYYTYNTDGSLKTVTLDEVETEYVYTTKGRQKEVLLESLAGVYYSYNKGNLSSIIAGYGGSSGDLLTYSFTYDSFGRTLSVKAMNHTLAAYTYQDKTGWLTSVTYGNGFVISYTYDVFGRTTKVKYNGVDQFSYVYDGNGNLFTFTDHENGVIYCYDYSSTGNLVAEEQFKIADGSFLQGQYYTYNSYGDVASSTLKIANQAPIKYICTYGYESSTSTQKLSVQSWKAKGSGYKVDYSYDGLGRATKQYLYPDLTGSSASSVLTRSYGYLVGANGNTTTLVSGLTYSGRSTSAYVYEYDARGNITAVYKNGTRQASYVYDDLNQLVRENNVTANKTWVYTYDIRGNILSRKTYAYATGTLGTVQDTDTYQYFGQSSEYLWGDGLLRYDGIEYISYDAIGNPTTYYNQPNLSEGYTFSWQNGRQLASGTKGTTEFAYTYNADGLRTKKVVNGVTTEYYWAGSQLAMMIVNPDLPTKKVLKFYYDAEGRPMCLDFNGTVYLYITNLQGDVVALADQYGEVIRYEYDAWGKPISTYYAATPYHDAMYYNPLRYRGYIYDNETGFYYLQSRYYDPVVSRFINSDGQLNEGFLGNNMFAYCENNPISYYDPDGEFAISAMLIGIAVGMVIGFTVTACVDYSDDGKVFNGSVSAEGYIVNIVVGGLVGGFTGGVGSSTFTVSLPTLQVLQTTIGTLEIVMGTTTVGVSGLVVAGAGVVGVAAAGSLMYHKPDSGSIRFNDGTGIDPDTGKPVDNKERAIEIYRSLKDTKQKLNWKAWMKGKGWRSCHLK